METGRAPSHVALNRKDLELLCSKISEDRILLAAQTARLMFLTQPSDHPHRGKIWTKGIPDFALVERAGTPPFWAKPLGENLSWSCYRTKDGKELAWYDVFLAGKEKAMIRFREICYASAALLFSDADIPESVFVPELFEFCRLNGLLKWEINEEPNHPETRGQIAWLHDLFAATLLFLNAQFKSPEKPTEAVGDGGAKRNAIKPIATLSANGKSRTRTLLCELEEFVLLALGELKAFDKDKRRTAEQIANHLDPKNDRYYVKKPLAELTQLKFVDSHQGRNGGSWLTAKGKRRFDSENAKR